MQESPTTKLEVVQAKLTDLTLDPGNSRKHGRQNLDAIKSSLATFGQRRPLVVMADMTVIAGNGTLTAMRELGWTECAITITPADWTAEQAKAYALADNRTAELAEWDNTQLATTLAQLDEAGWPVQDLGFEQSSFDDDANVVQDEVPDVPEEATRTKTGQLWQLGDSRLLVGDSTDPDDFAHLMRGDLADCVFTDPPYNVAYEGGTAEALTIQNDDMSDADFKKFLNDAYTRMFEVTKEGGAIYVCHADSEGENFRAQFSAAGWLLKQCLIWVKDAFVLGRQDYHWQHEPILYGWKPGAAHTWYGRRIRSTILDGTVQLADLKKHDLIELLTEIVEASTIVREPRPRRNGEHPTMKPVPLVARLVANSTKPGDLVLDPFGGSGSTLIACVQMDRACYTIEKDPRYADVIVNRWEKLTGLTAELVTE
jgi:site-specific DNA-methyltransferase (adenine-specific)